MPKAIVFILLLHFIVSVVVCCLCFGFRKPLEDMEELSCTDTECKWKNKAKKAGEGKYLPQPLEKINCFKTSGKRQDTLTSAQDREAVLQEFLMVAQNSALSSHIKGRRQITVNADKCDEENTQDDTIPEFIFKILNNSEQSQFLENLDISDSISTTNDCCNEILSSFQEDNILEGICTRQGTSEWKQKRKNRITGSTCYSVFTFKKKDWSKMLANFFSNRDIRTKEIVHGREQEDCAVETFQKCNPNCEVKKMGILICSKYPWLAYSPDGVTFQDNEPKRLLEIKCPYLGKLKTAEEVIPTLPYLEKDFTLKRAHAYYAQVQLGMALLNLQTCDFVIYFSKDQSYLHITVPFDEGFAKNLIQIVSKKYFNNMIHYICQKQQK